MARVLNLTTIKVLKTLSENPGVEFERLQKMAETGLNNKDFYNTLFRLERLEMLSKKKSGKNLLYNISEEGGRVLRRAQPERDGVWKLVIFDIPEKQKYVRTVLRAKLKALHFKKWQNSIWVSPFELDAGIEEELNQLAKKFFVRLIKTTDINHTEDLQKLFGKQ